MKELFDKTGKFLHLKMWVRNNRAGNDTEYRDQLIQ